MTASDGGAPSALSIAHRTAASKPHQAIAPSRRGSPDRTRAIASRTPVPIAAGVSPAAARTRASREDGGAAAGGAAGAGGRGPAAGPRAPAGGPPGAAGGGPRPGGG